ncbi:MAG: LysM peptidoglycan-binding domain-containing protein [Anaerolineae bacterium]|nr:LysM peptidoglycan-binding domain-containing protein [Anaerolineae bacterium]
MPSPPSHVVHEGLAHPHVPLPVNGEGESDRARKSLSACGEGFREGLTSTTHRGIWRYAPTRARQAAPLQNVRLFYPLLVVALLILAGMACSRGGGEDVIYVTATPYRDEQGTIIIPPTVTSDAPTNTPIQPTPNPARAMPETTGGTDGGSVYTVQPGDTLMTIAGLYNTTIEDILAANSLSNPNVLEVGQQLIIPGGTILYGPDNKLIPDSELVYGPNVGGFSVISSVKFTQGFLKAYSEDIDGEIWSGVEIIDFVARNYSVNPRLLLALLEYRGGWLSTPYPTEGQITYPLGILTGGREGLYRQLWDAANALNAGYYGWKYRGTLSTVFDEGRQVFYAPGLNPGTVGVQYMLSLTNTAEQWQRDVHPNGFFQTYLSLFGDPFALAYEPITPTDLAQPALTLPFPPGEEWVYTGGPHGGYNSGSAWSAVDFAPPKPPDDVYAQQGRCYISAHWAIAAAPGVVARSGDGYVILDLDGDGDEHTGWTLVYLHIDDHERIEAGTKVQAGDQLGHPSCQGGVSNGTHLHFARRYNGEWIPVQCTNCAPTVTVPPLVLGEWTLRGWPNQEYQGYMTRISEDGYRQADQTREYTQNKVIW